MIKLPIESTVNFLFYLFLCLFSNTSFNSVYIGVISDDWIKCVKIHPYGFFFMSFHYLKKFVSQSSTCLR